MAKKLMKGNEAIGEAAIQAGCRLYFCYPITPQTEVAEYLARRMPEVGGVFLQAESEVAASNMLFGAAGAGVRCFTSSSSPGISLMAEAISYMAGARLPVVLVNIMRGGPGLGGILPAQSDYFQATKGGAHGDFRMLVLAPSTVQEAVDLMIHSFGAADRYRLPVMVVGDGMLGQMMEPVDLEGVTPPPEVPKPWATTGAKGRKPNVVTSLFLNPDELEANNLGIQAAVEEMREHELRWEEYRLEEPVDTLLVSYGTMARIAKTAIDQAADKEGGERLGLFRPISLFPFPEEQLREAASRAKRLLVVELSLGQMLEDVKLAVGRDVPVHFFGRVGGNIPSPEDLLEEVEKLS